MIFADRFAAIAPEGDLLRLLNDGNAEATARFEAGCATVNPSRFATLSAPGGSIATWMASVTFGGADLKTVCLRSLQGAVVPFFDSPAGRVADPVECERDRRGGRDR